MRKNSPALQAFEDRQRRMTTDHIRKHGVHLTYIIASDDHETECGACRELGADEAGAATDPLAHVVDSTDGLPRRLHEPFCYTTGLHGIGHPELIVLGLPPDPAMSLLNLVAHRVTGHHEDLIPGQLVPGFRPEVLVEEVPNPGMVVFEANNYYGRPFVASVPAYQLTWADAQGRFPWDEGHQGGPWGQPRPGTYRA